MGVPQAGLHAALLRVLRRGGEPLVRTAMDRAMRVLGEQFVVGETIEDALRAATKRERLGFRYSFDMLGEAALTEADAQGYLAGYEHAIRAIGAHNRGRALVDGAGISIKLSALHPRYCRAQQDRVRNELLPRLRALASLARQHDVGLNIDAEEADRLEISLDLLQGLCEQPDLQGWNGIGFVIQAYGRRTPAVIAHLVALARETGHRLMVRLVKGAYWDSEIKKAQEGGHAGLSGVHAQAAHRPVVSRLRPAAAGRAGRGVPAVRHAQRADRGRDHGHGRSGVRARAVRVPVPARHGRGAVRAGGRAREARPAVPHLRPGRHARDAAGLPGATAAGERRQQLLRQPHRRPERAGVALVADPVRIAAAAVPPGAPHASIPSPSQLFGAGRRNASGLDLSAEDVLAALGQRIDAPAGLLLAEPVLAFEAAEGPWRDCTDPADRRVLVGRCRDAQAGDVPAAVAAAARATAVWNAVAPADRADRLDAAADRLDALLPELLAPIIREAGKSAANAVGEVREAVDFLRFYAAQLREPGFGGGAPLGPVVCISPWNFPLAIFVGQVAAALAAGNAVLAKPAEETPLIAALAVRVLHEAGIPRDVLQFLPGDGAVGAALVSDARIGGVMFTGSTAVAQSIARALAPHADAVRGAIPLVAETGGQNALVVDSAALPEQVVVDALASAFDSAGQRCSALRVLCVQEEAADRTLRMLKGALLELRVGDPRELCTDVGPVIGDEARDGIEAHVARMAASGCRITRAPLPPGCEHGSFVAPTLIEIDAVEQLGAEVFGPVLHVLRYREGGAGRGMEALIDAINATGYGLTFGVHTRIDETVRLAADRSTAGNVYVNRNLIGAVVGSQPFGGTGLSGTGPKAGGPLILHRLRRTDVDAAPPPGAGTDAAPEAARRLLALLDGHPAAAACAALVARGPLGPERVLPGPVGERNSYRLRPRGAVLCVAEDEHDLLLQLAAALAAGNQALLRRPAGEAATLERLVAALPGSACWELASAAPAAALASGSCLPALARELAAREGAVVPLHRLDRDDAALRLEWLTHERSLSVNTTAAGGNASLMVLS